MSANAEAIKSSGTFAFVLRQWPDLATIARDLNISYFTVAAWLRRDSIPSSYWDDLAAAAEARGLPDISYTRFRAIAAERQPKRFAKPPPIQAPSTPLPRVIPQRPDKLGTKATVAQDAQLSVAKPSSIVKAKPHTGRKHHAP